MVLIAAAIGLTLMFAPALAWGSTLMVGTLVGLAVLKGLIAACGPKNQAHRTGL
jgi:hypothetical protein